MFCRCCVIVMYSVLKYHMHVTAVYNFVPYKVYIFYLKIACGTLSCIVKTITELRAAEEYSQNVYIAINIYVPV